MEQDPQQHDQHVALHFQAHVLEKTGREQGLDRRGGFAGLLDRRQQQREQGLLHLFCGVFPAAKTWRIA